MNEAKGGKRAKPATKTERRVFRRRAEKRRASPARAKSREADCGGVRARCGGRHAWCGVPHAHARGGCARGVVRVRDNGNRRRSDRGRRLHRCLGRRLRLGFRLNLSRLRARRRFGILRLDRDARQAMVSVRQSAHRRDGHRDAGHRAHARRGRGAHRRDPREGTRHAAGRTRTRRSVCRREVSAFCRPFLDRWHHDASHMRNSLCDENPPNLTVKRYPNVLGP